MLHLPQPSRSSALLKVADGRITAVEGRALGVHVAYAPVLDVNNNPGNPVIGPRSFGEDPQLVAGMGAAFIRAMQANGMLATAKHFPGHGDTEVNSHLDLPTIRVSRARLDSVELVPFRAAIQAGVGAGPDPVQLPTRERASAESRATRSQSRSRSASAGTIHDPLTAAIAGWAR